MIDWKDRLPWDTIHENADAYGIDPNLIAAIVMVESSGSPIAQRFEPKWKYFYKPEQMDDIERLHQATSWGQMQLMGSVARELGYTGPLDALCQPDLGIKYGCIHLRSFLHKYADLDDAIASYNAGSPRKTDDGVYVNQNYVSQVHGYMTQLQNDEAALV